MWKVQLLHLKWPLKISSWVFQAIFLQKKSTVFIYLIVQYNNNNAVNVDLFLLREREKFNKNKSNRTQLCIQVWAQSKSITWTKYSPMKVPLCERLSKLTSSPFWTQLSTLVTVQFNKRAAAHRDDLISCPRAPSNQQYASYSLHLHLTNTHLVES